ncbi:MAG: efflux RND transporter permease subunit [Ichthyobacteriaceae bacterium]|nr:efflux RND transporter permease subunit [Ichthyobacteriaceae bacterium]
MRKIITYFIKYPVATNVLIFALVVFGYFSMINMGASFFPLIKNRMITIQGIYPGASPKEVEEGIIIQIEENLRGISGVERFTSTSSENMGTVKVEILKGYDTNKAFQDVKNAVDRIASFPAMMEPIVVFKNENTNRAIGFVVSGDDVSLKSLKDAARKIEDDLRRLGGISKITLYGFPDEEIEIAVNETKMRSYNLTFEQVAAAVRNENIDLTGGKIKTDKEEYLIRGRAKEYYAHKMDNILIRSDKSGKKVLLKDIATVTDRWSDSPNEIHINGSRSIYVNVMTTDDEDLVSVVEKVAVYIEEYNQTKSGIDIEVTNNMSDILKSRQDLLINNGLSGMLLVLLFLSLFLNPRMAFWVAAGFPVSFLGMFILGTAYGMTVNMLSLFGMIVVIGILVDDGIVIAENVYHHYEKGKNSVQAAIDGTMEVIPSIVSAVLTTMIAFGALFFLDGRLSDFFGEVAFVVVATLAISLIEALIFLPSHLAHSKGLSGKKKDNIITKTFDKIMFWMRDKLYMPVLVYVLKNKSLTFATIFAMFIISLAAVKGGVIGKTFFPNMDRATVPIVLKMPAGTKAEITMAWLEKIEKAAQETNDYFSSQRGDSLQIIETIYSQTGPATSDGKVTIIMLDAEIRNLQSDIIVRDLKERIGATYGVEYLSFGSGSHFGKPVSVAFVGQDLEELNKAKIDLKAELNKMPALRDVMDDDPKGIKEIDVKLKDKAYMLGLSLRDVMGQVRSGFFGKEVQRLQRGRDQVKIWVRYDEDYRASISNLDEMRITTKTGQRIPFAEVATYTIQRGTVAINHLDAQREIIVEADLMNEKSSASDIMAEVKENIVPEILAKYPSVEVAFEGQVREMFKTKTSAALVLPIMFFLIFAVITFTFRSFGQTVLVLLLIPFSSVGVIWGHWIHDIQINILSALGIVALVGVLVNDALVFVGKFNGYLKEGIKFDEALKRTGYSRFRPIFLTSLTTIAGLAPMLFEKSTQAQFLKPMAISIGYGILFSTIITLVMFPIMIKSFNNMKRLKHKIWTGESIEPELLERAIREQEAERKAGDI